MKLILFLFFASFLYVQADNYLYDTFNKAERLLYIIAAGCPKELIEGENTHVANGVVEKCYPITNCLDFFKAKQCEAKALAPDEVNKLASKFNSLNIGNEVLYPENIEISKKVILDNDQENKTYYFVYSKSETQRFFVINDKWFQKRSNEVVYIAPRQIEQLLMKPLSQSFNKLKADYLYYIDQEKLNEIYVEDIANFLITLFKINHNMVLEPLVKQVFKFYPQGFSYEGGDYRVFYIFYDDKNLVPVCIKKETFEFAVMPCDNARIIKFKTEYNDLNNVDLNNQTFLRRLFLQTLIQEYVKKQKESSKLPDEVKVEESISADKVKVEEGNTISAEEDLDDKFANKLPEMLTQYKNFISCDDVLNATRIQADYITSGNGYRSLQEKLEKFLNLDKKLNENKLPVIGRITLDKAKTYYIVMYNYKSISRYQLSDFISYTWHFVINSEFLKEPHDSLIYKASNFVTNCFKALSSPPYDWSKEQSVFDLYKCLIADRNMIKYENNKFNIGNYNEYDEYDHITNFFIKIFRMHEGIKTTLFSFLPNTAFNYQGCKMYPFHNLFNDKLKLVALANVNKKIQLVFFELDFDKNIFLDISNEQEVNKKREIFIEAIKNKLRKVK